MDTIRIAGAPSLKTVDELLAAANTPRAPETQVRTLQDWELALASGGDLDPTWP